MIRIIVHKLRSVATEFEVGVLKRRAEKYGYEIRRKPPVSESEIVIENYYKTNYSKNALISYIVYPFVAGVQNYHSNVRECLVMAEILRELQFNVDVIHWDNTSYVPVKKYGLIIDNHTNLERLSPYIADNGKKVFHATNANWLFQNWVEYGRYYDFFLKTGVAIAPPRIMEFANSAEHSDAISIFGNDFTRNTYGRYADKVTQIPMSVTTSPEIIGGRDFSKAKKKFVWLNSHGALLKGLDIVIDAFTRLPHLELIICGDLDRDEKFKQALNTALANAVNIRIAGWVDIEGEPFKAIAAEAAWVLGTSFSEGGGGSTLNCMAKGLIPVVSRATSLTLPDNTGFYIQKNDADGLVELIDKLVCLEDRQLKEMSFNAYSFVVTNHTIENFRARYKDFLKSLLSS